MKFQYLHESIDGGAEKTTPPFQPKYSPERVQKQLNARGAEGWDLVSISPKLWDGVQTTFLCTFKKVIDQ